MIPCQACAPDLIETAPSDFAPASTYFEEAPKAPGCTDCEALANTTPPDLAAGGGTYFETPPTNIFPPESVFNDAQTVSCGTGGTSATVPAGTVSVFVAIATPAAITVAKQQANALALSQAQAELNITGGALSDSICGGSTYSKAFCIPPGATLAVTAGSLPAGLNTATSNQVTGLVYGVPSAGGTFNFTITATGIGAPVVYTFTLNIVNITSPGPLCADGGDTVSVQLAATGPPGAAFTFSLVSSVLPPGLSMSAAGLISGTLSPTTGIYTFTVQAADATSGITCKTTLQFQTSTNHPFDLITWLRAPTFGYDSFGINTSTAVSGTNTGCGGVLDGGGSFDFHYCTTPTGRLVCSSNGSILNLVGSFGCKVKLNFGAGFGAYNGDNFTLTVVQDGSTLLSQTWCFPQGACTNVLSAGTTVFSNPFTLGTSGTITIGLRFDSRTSDSRLASTVTGKLIGTSLCP